MKRILLIIILITAVFPAYSQNGTGGVKGRVVNRSDKAPVEGAELRLISQGDEIGYTFSGDDGVFVFDEIGAGDYEVEILAE